MNWFVHFFSTADISGMALPASRAGQGGGKTTTGLSSSAHSHCPGRLQTWVLAQASQSQGIAAVYPCIFQEVSSFPQILEKIEDLRLAFKKC